MSIAQMVDKGEAARQVGEAIIAFGRARLVPLGQAFLGAGARLHRL
jgi:hypothetical protein